MIKVEHPSFQANTNGALSISLSLSLGGFWICKRLSNFEVVIFLGTHIGFSLCSWANSYKVGVMSFSTQSCYFLVNTLALL